MLGVKKKDYVTVPNGVRGNYVMQQDFVLLTYSMKLEPQARLVVVLAHGLPSAPCTFAVPYFRVEPDGPTTWIGSRPAKKGLSRYNGVFVLIPKTKTWPILITANGLVRAPGV